VRGRVIRGVVHDRIRERGPLRREARDETAVNAKAGDKTDTHA
jgi:hypothetical protein